jgi:hypothetical protein
MIRLVCEKCDHIWYTSNTSINQKCDECGEILVELGIDAKGIENSETVACNTVTS